MTRNELVTLVVVLLMSASAVQAQWGPIVRLSETDSVSDADPNSLTARGQYVHAVWRDYHDGTQCLVYRRSADGGVSWNPLVSLTGYLPDSYFFTYSAGANVHLAYDSSGVRYRRSTDHGATWSARDSLTPETYVTYFTLAANGNGSLFLVWYWQDSLFVRRSTDDGASWSSPVPLVKPSMYAWSYINKVVADYPPYVYFLCHSSDDTLLLSRSTDNGATWETAVPVVVGSNLGWGKFAADDSNRLHLAWNSDHTGVKEVYYRRSTDNGASWGEVARLTTSTGSQLYWLDARDDVVYVGYDRSYWYVRRSFDGGATWDSETRWPSSIWFKFTTAGEGRWVHALFGSYGGIEYLRSKDAGTSWGDTAVVSDTSLLNRYPRAMMLEGGNVHVLWQDYQYGNYEVLYRRGAGLADIEEQNPPLILPDVRGPTVLSSEKAVRFARSGLVYDVMGRRTFDPEPGVYFVRETKTQAQNSVIRKVVVAR